MLGGRLRRCPGRVTAFLNHPLQGRRESFASTLSRRRSWRSQSTSPRTSTSWTSPSGTKSSSCRRAGGHSPCARLCPVLSGWQGGGPGGHVLGARRGSWSRVKCLLRFRGLGLGVGRPRSPAPQFSLRGSEGRGFCEPKQAGGDVPPPWAVPTEQRTVPEPPRPSGPLGSVLVRGAVLVHALLGACPASAVTGGPDVSSHFCAAVTRRPSARSCRRSWTRSWR